MKKILIILGWIAVIVGIGLTLLILYWLIWPYNPLTFQRPKFIVKTKTVKAGELLVYDSFYCKNVDLPARVTRSFQNELVFSIPEITSNRPTGCHIFTVSMVVPKELPSGTYHLRNIYRYRVNPIRTIIIEHESEEFTVI